MISGSKHEQWRRIYTFLVMLVMCIFIPLNVKAGELNIDILDVGQGLSVLFESDGHYMIYDGGGREKSSYVVSYLKRKGISELDYIIASHYDEDHISGLVGVLNVFDCEVILSPDYVADTAIYNSFIQAEITSGADVIHPIVGQQYSLGSSEFMIIGPNEYQDANDNDNSISIRVKKSNVSCLVCGDAEAKEEGIILSSGMEITSDIYIVNHHGSGSSTTDEFLSQVKPSVAVISCGADNAYGHPESNVMERLQNHNCYLFRTDLQGEICLSTDGEQIFSSIDASEDWSPGSITTVPDNNAIVPIAAIADSDSDGISYVCNENTKKFHNPSCNSVSQMKEKNRRDTSQSREELIAQGYDPCKNCNP